MLKNLPLYVGLRYTRSVRGEGYLSFVSALSMGAMAIGVMALITVLSVMNGFDREIKSRLLRIMPHLVALPEESLASADYLRLEKVIGAHAGVEAMIPLAQSYIMLSRADQKLGAMLRGIDPADTMHADLRQDMLAGDLTSLRRGDYGVVVGSQIARKLGLSMGDKLQLTLPQLSVTPLGMFPRIKSARVIGIFQVGAQVDGSMVLMHRGDVQKLLRLGDRYQGIQIQLRDPYAVATQMGDFVDLLPSNTDWHSWQQSMASLFDAMRMEKQIVRLLLSVIVAVAAFNIVASLVLMVSNKRADIAVIRTLGASSATVMKIFMVQGVAVGCVGIAIGTLLGCLLAANIGDLLSLIESVLGVQKLLRLGDRYQGIQIQLRDPYAVATQMGDFVDLLPSNTDWHSWQQSMASLFDAMRMEKQIVRLLLSVIVAVAAFNIVASLVLMVSNKRADIAVIRTLGASSATVMKIFMVQGVAVGCVGIAIGTLLGCLLAANIGDLLSLIESVLGVHLFDPSVYLISVLPSKVLLTDVLSVALTSLALCSIASLYPAWRAAQIQPAEALRYDI